MKGLKTILGIALATAGLGGAVAFGVAETNHVEHTEIVEAASTVFTEAAVYLDNSAYWKNGDERFAVYWSTGSETGWNSMQMVGTNFYCAKLPDKPISLIIFCRMNGSNSTNNWDNKWNQTNDITSLTNTSAVYKISGWGPDGGKSPGSWQANSGYTSKFADRYVACADNGWAASNSNYKMTLDMTKAEARLEKEFTVSGSETVEPFKVTNGTWDESFGCSHVSNGTNGTYIDLSEGGNNNIGLKQTGTYEIYWKYHDMESKEIWVQISSSSEADIYAEDFMNAITCTNTSTTFNINVWNEVGDARTSMESKFNALTSGARHLLQNATANKDSSDNLEKCVARYDRILSKYGYGTAEGQYHDFMGRSPTPLAGSRSITATSNNAGLIAIIASFVAITSVGAFFILRKKKHQ